MKKKLGCTMSSCEKRLGFAATTLLWDREVARARYVDDVLWISGVYCQQCLHLALDTM